MGLRLGTLIQMFKNWQIMIFEPPFQQPNLGSTSKRLSKSNFVNTKTPLIRFIQFSARWNLYMICIREKYPFQQEFLKVDFFSFRHSCVPWPYREEVKKCKFLSFNILYNVYLNRLFKIFSITDLPIEKVATF